MAISRDTITYNLDDCRLFPLTADPVGGAAVYGNGVDVAGVQNHSANMEYITAEQKGDAQTLDVYSKPDKVTGSVRHAMIGLDTLATLTGGAVSTDGVTPNESVTFDLLGTNLPGYFKLESQIRYLGGADVGGAGDFHIVIHKVRVTGFSIEFSNESYAQVSFDYSGLPLQSTGKMLSFVKNETAIAIPTVVDTTPPTVSASSPADGDSGVDVDAAVTFTFSEPMMPSSMAPASFFLVATDGSAKEFALSYSAGTKVATLTPTTNFAGSTVYIAGVTTGARDLAGNRLAAQHVINFTTA